MEERTFELAKANQQLKDKADNLKEANIALNVLLKKRENDKKELEEKVLLNVKELVISSTDTIDFHRKNIRKKLGLQNTKSNLRSYLLSLI